MDNFEGLNDFANSWWPYVISFFISIIISIRVFMGGPKCPCAARIDGKIVLITGPTSGIGYEVAKVLAERGGEIILACRNPLKGRMILNMIKKECPNGKLDLRILDVSLLFNIRSFVKELAKTYDRIDILINNAAVINQSYQTTNEKLDITLSTNYLGPFLLTHLLLPLLKKSPNGRIINISAAAHYTAALEPSDLKKEYHSEYMFGQTKLAIVFFTKYLAKLLKGTNITVNAVSPGLVRDTNHYKTLDINASLMGKISTWPWKWLLLKTPKQGCQTILYAATEPTLNTITGQYLSDCEIKEPNNLAKEENLMRKIYETTCRLCELEPNCVYNLI